MARTLTLRSVCAALVVLAGCAEASAPPAIESLATMREAADASEHALGVPAELVLAIAWTQSRWQQVEGDAHGAELLGVGGLRSWRVEGEASAPADVAASAMGVDRARLAEDPIAAVVGRAIALRPLAAARGAVPEAHDVAAWSEVIADYAGLDGEEARAAHVEAVLDVLRRGVDAEAATGERIVLHGRAISLRAGVAGACEYGGAEYPSARWVAASSANYSAGRGGRSVRYIVIHDTEGSYSGAISWFQNPSASVSAHYVIRSSDGQITQMVAEGHTAWHAGNFDYNQQAIGIEHEGFARDPSRWYTEAMYQASAELVRHLCTKYGIPMDREHIIAHSEVPRATHTDPGPGWNWDHYMDLVRGTPPRPAYAATYAAQSVPAEMTSGERAVAWIEYRNDGSAAWQLDRTFLGTSSPRDHASPFFDLENWVSDHRASGPDHSDYGTGATGRFSFMITAPEVGEDTRVSDTFALVQEGVTWFGDDARIEVLVHPRVAPTPPASDAGTEPEPEHDAGTEPEPTADAATPVSGADAGTSAPGMARPTASGCSVGHGGGADMGRSLLALALLALLVRRPRAIA